MVSRSIYYQALWYCNRGNYGPTGNSRLNLKEIANRAESSELFAPVRFYYILSFCRKMIFLIEFRGVPSRIANTLNRFLFIGSARLGPGSSYILGLCMKIETPLRPLIWQGNVEGRKSKEKNLQKVLKIVFKRLKRGWITNMYKLLYFYFLFRHFCIFSPWTCKVEFEKSKTVNTVFFNNILNYIDVNLL